MSKPQLEPTVLKPQVLPPPLPELLRISKMKKSIFYTGISLFGCEVLLSIEAKNYRQQMNKKEQVMKWFEKIYDNLSPIKNTSESKEVELAHERQAIRAMVKAFKELNTIRVRDGVPYTSHGWQSSVTMEYFSSVIDELDEAVKAITGKSAHCHPELYK